mgnify:CR=1 FL=1
MSRKFKIDELLNEAEWAEYQQLLRKPGNTID